MNLIINADDFGRSEDINNTILWLHKKGIVSSTTIMAEGACFSMAVDISKNNPKLGTGVHLCLDGPFNIGTNYNTILNSDKSQFHDKNEIIRKLRTFSADESEIYKEYCLQIEKVLDHGIKISHLDHHHHLHLYPSALRMIIKAAKKFKISYIRSQRIFSDQPLSLANHFYRNIHQFYLKRNLNTADGYFVPGFSSSFDEDNHFNRLLKLVNFNRDVVEIVLHPVSKNDPETIFFSEERVVSFLKSQVILNYNSLE
jgi:predicted glycoside hydrolase/deacetylase ChbG (UPF0249 family)